VVKYLSSHDTIPYRGMGLVLVKLTLFDSSTNVEMDPGTQAVCIVICTGSTAGAYPLKYKDTKSNLTVSGGCVHVRSD
jgi:hypothetical protein